MGATKGIEGAWVRRKTTREGVGVGKGLVVLQQVELLPCGFIRLSEPMTNSRLLFSSLPMSPLEKKRESPSHLTTPPEHILQEGFALMQIQVCTLNHTVKKFFNLVMTYLFFCLFLPFPNSCWLGHGSGGECNKGILQSQVCT